MFTATRNGLGIAVNEMQRSINGAGLGDVPNDFEAAIDLQYTPVRQGWYYGYPSTGGGYASVQRCSRGGFADATTDTELTAVQTLAKAQKAQALLQIVSTISIAVIASLAVARAIHVARHGNGARVFGDDDDDAAW